MHLKGRALKILNQEVQVGLLDVKSRFKLQLKHQNANVKKYFFGDFLSTDLWQKLKE